MTQSHRSFFSVAVAVAVISCLAACAGPSSEGAASSASAGLVKIASNDPMSGAIADASHGPVQEALQTTAFNNADDTVAKTMALWHAIRARAMTQPVEWANRSTGAHGSAQIIREVAIPDSDRVCREFRQSGVIDGRQYRNYGQVCQEKSGDWSLIQG